MLLAALPSKMDENWILHDIYNVDGCVREEWEWYCNDLCMREEWERDQERKEKEPEEEVEGEPAEKAVDVDAVDDVEVATASRPVEGATTENAPVQNAPA